MDGWDTEDLDDFPGEFDDSEYDGEVARRALRRRGGGRSPGRLVTTTQGRAAMERTRRLEAVQKRNAVQQSSDTFGPIATAAAGAFALSRDRRDVLNAALTHALPITQILTTSRGRAIGAAFRANPVASLGFPLAAVALGLLKDKLPGFAPVKVEPPEADVTSRDGGKTFVFRVKRQPAGTVVFYSKAAAGTDPGAPGTQYTKPVTLGPGDQIRYMAKIGDAKSETVDDVGA